MKINNNIKTPEKNESYKNRRTENWIVFIYWLIITLYEYVWGFLKMFDLVSSKLSDC